MEEKQSTKTFMEKAEEIKSSKKDRGFLINRNETIALFLFTALLFATLYFVQIYITNSRINDIIEYSDSRINSVLVVDSKLSENISTNYTSVTKEDLKSVIDTTLEAHRLAINEDIKQVIQANNDVNNFWLSFILVIVLIFSIFTIIINRDYAGKTQKLSDDFQKKIDDNKDLSLKFMREFISISNKNRNIKNDNNKESLDTEPPSTDAIVNMKKEILEEMESSLYDIKNDIVELFGSEILEIYNSIYNKSRKKSGNKNGSNNV